MSALRRAPGKVVRLAAVAALALIALSPAALGASNAPTTSKAPAGTIAFYNANAVGNGVTVGFNIVNLLPLPQLVSLSSVTAQARISIGISTALAVLPSPGDLVLSLPGTASGLAHVSGLPDYPAAARSDFPITPEAEVDLAPDAGLGAGKLTASSGEEASAASAFLSGLAAPVGVVPFTLDGVRSDAVTTRTGDSSFEVTTTSTASGLNVLGGLLRIGSVTSEAKVTMRDGVPTPLPPTTTVAGASVLGTPVGITDKGIVAADNSNALAPLVDAAASSLKAAGITVHTTPTTTEQSDGHALAASGQLLIELTTTVSNLPTVVSLSFGDALASLDIGGAPTAPLVAVTTPSTTSTGAVPSGASGSSGGGVRTPGASATAPSGSTAAPAASSSGTNRIVPIVDLLDFRPLYRALAAAGLALLLARWLVHKVLRNQLTAHPDVRALWRW